MIVFSVGIVSKPICCDALRALPAGLVASRAARSLVLTDHAPLRERLRSIAVAGGYVCRAPITVAAAWRELGATPHLAFIDVARPLAGHGDEARAMAEALAQRCGVLLAICGSPAEVGADGPRGADDDECWARQMGAFVYLPGVGSDAGVGQIVAEARRVFRGLA